MLHIFFIVCVFVANHEGFAIFGKALFPKVQFWMFYTKKSAFLLLLFFFIADVF